MTVQPVKCLVAVYPAVMQCCAALRRAATLLAVAMVAVAALAAGPTLKTFVQKQWSKWQGHDSTPETAAEAVAAKLRADLAQATGNYTPPTLGQKDANPLLRNPHQTFNLVARGLKDQAQHVQLATADTDLGQDAPAAQLREQLQGWWRKMQKLAELYQKMQGKFSGMLYGQDQVLGELRRLYSVLISNVESMLHLSSCRSSRSNQVEMCRKYIRVLLEECRNATAMARVKIAQQETLAQEVLQEQDSLASKLGIAANDMQAASHTALRAVELATADGAVAGHNATVAKKIAGATNTAALTAGLVSVALCALAPLGCAVGIAGTGSTILVAGVSSGRLTDAQTALDRSKQLTAELKKVHVESLRADRATSDILEVVVAQSTWVRTIVNGLNSLDGVLSDVIEVTLKYDTHAREVVLRQLHRELSSALTDMDRLHDKSIGNLTIAL